MSARFWVGGTGNWDAATTTNWAATSGGVGGQSVPTSGDTVTFDTLSNATAYTVTVTATANCSDISFTNPLTGALTFAGSSILNVFGNFTIVSTITRTYTGTITFKATATGKTITTNSVALGGLVTFDGVGGEWTLQDAFNIGNNAMTVTNGSFKSNNQTISVQSINSNNSNTRGIDLGSSVVSAVQPTWNWSSAGTGLTYSFGTSSISFSSAGGAFIMPTGTTVYDINMSANGNISFTGVTTFHDLTVSGNSKTVTLADNITVNIFKSVGNNATTQRIFWLSSVLGTPRTITATSISGLTKNVDFQDITGVGAAGWDLHSISSGDATGNSGITFTAAVDQHWIKAAGAGGNWSGGATNWTTRTPLPQDDVFFDFAFGTSQTVTGDMLRLGHNISWAGATFTTALTYTSSVGTTVYGSLILVNGMTYSSSTGMTLAGRGSLTLSGNGATLNQGVILAAISSVSYALGSDTTFASGQSLIIGAGSTLSAVNGSNNYALSFGTISISGTLTLGSNTTSVTGTGTSFVVLGGGVITATTGTIKFTDTSNSAVTFNGGSKTYGKIWWSRGASTATNTLLNTNTFLDWRDDGTGAHTQIWPNVTTTITNGWHVMGASGAVITFTRTGAAGTFTLSTPAGIINTSDWLSISNSTATGGAKWYAGSHSTDGGGNTGWIFTDAPNINLSLLNVG